MQPVNPARKETAMNKLGISSSCYYPLVTEKSFEKICLSGVKCAEIFFNSPGELEKSFIRELTARQKEYGVDIVSVHPYMSFAEDFFLFSPYERRFTDILPLYGRFFEVCNELGAMIFVIHGAKIPGSSTDELYCERFARLTELGKTYGVNVCQENVVRYRSESAEYLKMMRDAIGGDFGVVLDIKQARRANITPDDIIDAVGDCIRHVHISDFCSGSDCVPPGQGQFDFPAFFRKMRGIGYDGAYMIEVYRHSYRDEHEIIESYRKVRDFLVEY